MAGRAIASISPRVADFARRTATPVKLEELYRLGCGGPADRLQMARFLHKEIAIRNAQLCKELQLLPFGLAHTRGGMSIIAWYSKYVDWLAECPEPTCVEGDRHFTELLRKILEDTSVIPNIGEAVQEVRDEMGEHRYEDIRSEISLILDRFFIKRIGLRFLLKHHIESAEVRPGVSGIIHSNVSVGSVLMEAAEVARQATVERCGVAPKIEVIGDGQHDRQFTYVPTHLSFMCVETLKNACEAVTRHHPALRLPSVQATYAHGDEEVSIKISDQGGGIARSDMHLAWSYFDVVGKHTVLSAAQGSGLPLARLHARYYGGDLVIKSMEGFGTDAYLYVNRLGQNCEKLPPGVRLSPAQRDSSVGEEGSIRIESLGTVSDQEAAFLEECLYEYRSSRQWRVDSVGGA